MTLVEALTALVDQVEKERLKRILSDVKQRVNEGSSLADALGQHQKIFGSLYVNMIRAGEHSGALDAVLLRLADFTESQAKLRQKILGTMIYPAIMMRDRRRHPRPADDGGGAEGHQDLREHEGHPALDRPGCSSSRRHFCRTAGSSSSRC